MTKPASRLFVYGTLMSTAQGSLGMAQRAQLARESRPLGPALLAGAQLFDLDRYPGLIETPHEAHVVHGEVVELVNPVRSLAWLDEYEGFVPGSRLNDYDRVMRTVRVAGGEALEAWVYVFLRDVSRYAHIRSGRWTKRFRR